MLKNYDTIHLHFTGLIEDMQDKTQILMEETGCDRGEADLALTSAGYDLERAIRTIGSLLKNIVVLKGKFHIIPYHYFGLMIFLADVKRKSIIRTRLVVSYNPTLYENKLDQDWYTFERALYGFRLTAGALPTLTQEMEGAFSEKIQKLIDKNLFSALKNGATSFFHQHLQEFLGSYFNQCEVESDLIQEEIDLDQFRRLKVIHEENKPVIRTPSVIAGGPLIIDMSLQEDPSGIPISRILPGDTVYGYLMDERDIARYLSQLLGGRAGEVSLPLGVNVEEVHVEGDQADIRVRLSSGISGRAKTSSSLSVRAVRASQSRWWKRWVNWWVPPRG